MNSIQNSFKPKTHHLDLQMNSIKFCEIHLYQTHSKPLFGSILSMNSFHLEMNSKWNSFANEFLFGVRFLQAYRVVQVI